MKLSYSTVEYVGLTNENHADNAGSSGIRVKSANTHTPLQTKTTNEPITRTENIQSKTYSPGSLVP